MKWVYSEGVLTDVDGDIGRGKDVVGRRRSGLPSLVVIVAVHLVYVVVQSFSIFRCPF